MLEIVVRLLALALLIYGIARVIPGMDLKGFKAAVSVALVYSLLNFILFKVLLIVTFPLVLLKYATLGLFAILINALLLVVTDKLLDGFSLRSFWTAIWAALGISLANLLINQLVPRLF